MARTRKLKKTRLITGLLPLTLAIAPAAALERSGTSTIEVDGKTVRQREFKTTFDPATGAFSRQGGFTLPNGRSVTYRIEGQCTKGSGCTWTGSGTGPFGGNWTGKGDITQVSDRETIATGTLTGPGGRTVTVNRKVVGDDILAAVAAARSPRP